jgi:transposase
MLKRRYPTHTEGIRLVAAWLREHRVTDVAMEATGVYWKPVWNALEEEFHLHLCNPHHVRAIPGSKTDLRDGTRIAELLAYGKLPESFIPPRWQRELRDLTRLRARFRQEAGRTANRIQKVLEDAQIKLASVASDVLGVSGRDMLRALVEGVQDPAQLAELAQGRLKAKKPELRRALEGDFREHHRFQLKLLLKDLEQAEGKIAQLDARIAGYTQLYQAQAQQLDEVPGFDATSIAAVLAEVGPNMQPWENDEKLASWCCICPGNRESGGKRLSGRTRKGNPWLRRVLCQTAWAATRKKGSYFRAQYHRLAGKRGKKRALLAVAHTQVRILYHLFSNPQLRYRELGEDFFDKRDAERTCRQLVQRLTKLGYEVALTPKTAAA